MSIMDKQKSILELSMTFFNVIGLNPLKKIRYVQVYATIISYFIIFGLVFLRFVYEEVSFTLISDTFESTFTIIHVFSNLIPMTFINKTFKDLIEKTDKFWYPKNTKFEKVLQILKYTLQTFIVFMIITDIMFVLRPIFGDTLAIPCYIPKNIPYSLFTIFNNFVFLGGSFTVAAYDMFTCVIVILVYVQFTILNDAIIHLDFNEVKNNDQEKECLEQIKMCVDHHNFLHEFLETLRSVVSPTFLIHFTSAPITLSFELFFMYKSSEFVEMMKSCCYLIGITVELLFFYCIPATFLHVESTKMVTALYFSGWHNCNSLVIRKNVIVMMQRMQKACVISAGQMFPVNLESCTKIFKMSFSFFTCLQILEEKSKQKLIED